MNYDRPDLLERLPAEYVLGTLRGRARRRFERLQREMPAARSAVASWEARLNTLGRVVPATVPPNRVWDAIVARTAPAREAPATPRRWSWLKPALGFAFGAALTLGLVQLAPNAFVSLERLAQQEQALPQSYVGLLTDANNVPHLLVSSTRHGTRVTVKSLRPWQVPAGKVAQVWGLPRDADGRDLPPVPLGIATPATPPGSTLRIVGELRTAPGECAAPRGVVRRASGLPGQTPAPFVFSGFCVKLW